MTGGLLLRTFLLILLAFSVTSPAAVQESAGAGKGDAATAESGAAPKGDAAPQILAVPRFRHIDPGRQVPDVEGLTRIRFFADGDFPPFSYLDSSGALTGFNVAVADAVCRTISLPCEFMVRPWDEIAPAVASGEADAALSGLAMNEDTLEELDFTTPFLRLFGRFAIRDETPIKTPDVRGLAGRRIGVVEGTAHAAYIEAYFPRSVMRAFKTDLEARQALQEGVIDVLFGDAFQLMFWVEGVEANGCCRLLPGGFVDVRYFSRGMAFAVKRGNTKLRDALDYGLDRVEISGKFAEVYRRFFPTSPW